MIRIMINLERSFAKQISPVINRQFMTAATLVEWGHPESIPFAVEEETPRLKKKLRNHYIRNANIFSEMAYEGFEEEKSFGIIYHQPDSAYETKGMREDFWDEMRFWTSTQTAEQITKVNNTTKKTIRKIIDKAKEEGLSNRDIAKKIRKTGLIVSKSRATTIARTETHTAANMSTDAAMRSTKLVKEKEWGAALDKRTRDPHAMANRERVLMDQYFIRTGERMMYPGDPAGSAWNVVNCRCIVLYYTVKKKLPKVV